LFFGVWWVDVWQAALAERDAEAAAAERDLADARAEAATGRKELAASGREALAWRQRAAAAEAALQEALGRVDSSAEALRAELRAVSDTPDHANCTRTGPFNQTPETSKSQSLPCHFSRMYTHSRKTLLHATEEHVAVNLAVNCAPETPDTGCPPGGGRGQVEKAADDAALQSGQQRRDGQRREACLEEANAALSAALAQAQRRREADEAASALRSSDGGKGARSQNAEPLTSGQGSHTRARTLEGCLRGRFGLLHVSCPPLLPPPPCLASL